MKDQIPPSYWAFRSVWTVLHFLVVLLAATLLLIWSLTDDNAEHLLSSATGGLLDLQDRIARAIPYPWQ